MVPLSSEPGSERPFSDPKVMTVEWEFSSAVASDHSGFCTAKLYVSLLKLALFWHPEGCSIKNSYRLWGRGDINKMQKQLTFE